MSVLKAFCSIISYLTSARMANISRIRSGSDVLGCNFTQLNFILLMLL